MNWKICTLSSGLTVGPGGPGRPGGPGIPASPYEGRRCTSWSVICMQILIKYTICWKHCGARFRLTLMNDCMTYFGPSQASLTLLSWLTCFTLEMEH